MKFKFICLNLWVGGTLFDQIINFLEKENPDILALQEVYDGKNPSWDRNLRTIEEFKKQFEFKDHFFSESFIHVNKMGKIPLGNAIFSRSPIVKKETFFYDVLPSEVKLEEMNDYSFVPRNLQHVNININEVSVNVFNTQGIWGFDDKDNERRLKMADTIIEKIKGKRKVILCGDFNVDQDTKTIAKIEQHLKNVFRGKLKTSFNMKRKTGSGFAQSVVDMIFVNSDINVLDYYCPKVDISDHLPLVVSLRV